ncbi:GATA zinc finger domain-containing protein 14-like [Crassostrea angulata]|uniref:GATA zinc finger domain-containing protein 14-like n=1 Tax=Magallana angulata TaxID=2784310 RepID=UPI0022B1D674|nr:GATA zinc finger domain-containing protein 14-like [Crassostrea angulata]
MFTCLLSLWVMVVTVEGQSAWETARTHRQSPQGFSLMGGHQKEPGTNRHVASHTAGHSTPPPSNGKISFQHSNAKSHGAPPETGTVNRQAPPNNAAQSQKTMTAKNAQPTQGSNPPYHTKHDAGWAAVHKGEVQQHHPQNTIVNKNLKRVIPSDKNSVMIVDHIWKMFQINSAANPTQTAPVSNTNQGHKKASGFRVKLRDAFMPANKVEKISSNDHKHPPMSTNHHNALNNLHRHNNIHNNNNHHGNHMNNHTNIHMNHHNNNQFNNNQFNNQVYNKSPYSNMNNNQQYNNNLNHNNQNNNQNNNNNNNKSTGGNYQGNVINPIKRVMKRVLSPYDKIHSGLETIKTEVGAQQGMLGQLQKSMDKMKEIFLAIQTDMKNVLNSINSIMNMQ